MSTVNPDVETTVQAGTFQGQRAFVDCRKLLRDLALADVQIEKRMIWARRGGCTFLVFIPIVLFFVFLPSLDADDVRVTWGAGLGILAMLATAIFCGVKHKQYRRLDLLNDFRTLLLPLLDELSEDVEACGMVRMDLDLTGLGPDKVLWKKVLKKGKRRPPPGRFTKVTQTLYDDPWCDVGVELADGNELRFRARNLVYQEIRNWTNCNGKPRSKTKWHKTVVVTAQLLPQSRLEWKPAEPDSFGKDQARLKFVEKDGVACGRVIRKFKYKTVNQEPLEVPPVAEVFGMFVQLYSLLNPTGQPGAQTC